MKQDHENDEIEDSALLLCLYRISQAGSAAFNVRDAYQAIMEAIQRLFRPSSASVALISPNTGLLEIEYRARVPIRIRRLRLAPGKGHIGTSGFQGRAYAGRGCQEKPLLRQALG